MAKQQYRTEIGILFDILSVIKNYGRQGVIISTIGRRANLSHDTAHEKCKRLEEAGLLKIISDDRVRFFVLTEKGINFSEELEKFLQVMHEVKIRC